MNDTDRAAEMIAALVGVQDRPTDVGIEVVDRLTAGLRAAVAAAGQNPTRLKQLALGRVRKSKVLGVLTPEKVEELIIDCAAGNEPLSVSQHPRGAHLVVYRFRVPAHWKAFGRCVQLGALLGMNSKFADFVEAVVIKRQVPGVQPPRFDRSVKFHAPQLSPVQTDIVTFIYNEATRQLEDWFAGEDPLLSPTVSNETVWVHCGVDLTQEK